MWLSLVRRDLLVLFLQLDHRLVFNLQKNENTVTIQIPNVLIPEKSENILPVFLQLHHRLVFNLQKMKIQSQSKFRTS